MRARQLSLDDPVEGLDAAVLMRVHPLDHPAEDPQLAQALRKLIAGVVRAHVGLERVRQAAEADLAAVVRHRVVQAGEHGVLGRALLVAALGAWGQEVARHHAREAVHTGDQPGERRLAGVGVPAPDAQHLAVELPDLVDRGVGQRQVDLVLARVDVAAAGRGQQVMRDVVLDRAPQRPRRGSVLAQLLAQLAGGGLDATAVLEQQRDQLRRARRAAVVSLAGRLGGGAAQMPARAASHLGQLFLHVAVHAAGAVLQPPVGLHREGQALGVAALAGSTGAHRRPPATAGSSPSAVFGAFGRRRAVATPARCGACGGRAADSG